MPKPTIVDVMTPRVIDRDNQPAGGKSPQSAVGRLDFPPLDDKAGGMFLDRRWQRGSRPPCNREGLNFPGLLTE